MFTRVFADELALLDELISVQAPTFLLISYDLQTNRNPFLGHPVRAIRPAATTRPAFVGDLLRTREC